MRESITIRDFYNRIVGYIETDTATGNKTVRDFYGVILGYYNKQQNTTTNFYGQVVARGDATSSLIKFDVK